MIKTWQIFDTKYQTTDGVIVKVQYGCTVQLDSFIARSLGELSFAGDSSAEGFVPYADLTENTVLEWVLTSLGEEKVIEIEIALETEVTSEKAAKEAEIVKSGLPWA